jgi:predicted acyl esterase
MALTHGVRQDAVMSVPTQHCDLVEARIPMDDGVELAATLYLPDPSRGPQPCILEALPYRKDDLTSSYRPDYVRLRDDHGYAACRLDLRGTGSSGGTATDEYPRREQQDLAAVLSWLAGQDWCTGKLGMYGTSYSGFNSLQMACERPPELHAVVAIYATDDRYTDDVHYRGGALKFLDLVDYNHYVTAMNALPPVPAVWGDGWRDEWRSRIAASEPWLLTWMREQADGKYWRHGSVRPEYGRIACPTMIVAGWADGYRNNSFRMVEALRDNGVPHRLLAGPWAHVATDLALPGPRIDLVVEMAAWWDRWLRGVDNGVGAPSDVPTSTADSTVDEASVTVFVRSSTRPQPDLDTSAGEWIREQWPSPRSSTSSQRLDARAPYVVRPSVGVDAWIDCAGHLPYGQSLDQRYDDAASLTWEWQADERTLIGHPVAELQISADTAVASCSVKLCDVFPDGTSSLVSRGLLNLTHRESHTAPQPLAAGEVYSVTIELDACAYRFDPGHRIRLSIAGADWPNTAAPPAPVTMAVRGGTLTLPLWEGPSPHAAPRLRDVAAAAGQDPGVTWRVERDVLARQTSCVVDHGSTYEAPYEATVREHYSGRVRVDDRTFEQRADASAEYAITWPETSVSSRATLELRADADSYDVTIGLTARENGVVVGTRSWHEVIARHLA